MFIAVDHLAGDCNQALVQQAMLMQEHLRRSEMQTAVLLSELRRVQVCPPASPIDAGSMSRGCHKGMVQVRN